MLGVCGTCLGAGEVFRVRSLVIDGQWRTVQGFVPCPACGDPTGQIHQHPSPNRHRGSENPPSAPN